eukprot:286120_1
MRGCEDVIVCGGLSDSKCFQNKLSKEFPKIQFHSPNDACRSVSIGGLYRISRDRSEDDTNKHRDINSPTGYSINSKHVSTSVLCAIGDDIQFNSDPDDIDDPQSHSYFGTVIKQNEKQISIKLNSDGNIHAYFID